MRTHTPLIGLLAAIMLTLLALVGHPYLPEKRLQVVPLTQGGAFYALYSDQLEGGPSHSQWAVRPGREGQVWRCHIEPEGTFSYCGINLLFSENNRDGLDLTGYHSVRAKLEVHNHDKRLRIFLRHYDYQYSNPDDHNSPQFSKFDIRTEELAEELTIGFDEFTLADWWVAERDLPREMMQPAFSNIIVLGIDYRESLPPGDYDVSIERIEFVGDWVSAEQWYLGILLLWLTGLFIWASHRIFTLNRATAQHRKRLRHLARSHSELKQETDKYREMSVRDPLTGAFNRYGFEQNLAEALYRETSRPLSLVVMDIDHFKEFNDRHGHDVGDRVLKHVVELLDQHTRGQDILCRWGGEEFVLLCPETDADHALILAEKIREVLAVEPLGLDTNVTLTASFGVCEMQEGESYIDAFIRADQALFKAKREGRNRVILSPD